MANKWLVHIKKTMKQMKSKGTYKKGMGLKQVIMAAKKTWHSMKGGDATPKEPETGDGFVQAAPAVEGGRRKTRRRRHSRRH